MKILVLVLAAGACTTSDDRKPEPLEPEVTLVGMWRAMPHDFIDPNTDELTGVWRFDADGTAQFSDHDVIETGQFVVDGDHVQLSMTSTEEVRDVTIAMTHDRLMIGALPPDGRVDGPIGTWTDESDGTSLTLDTARGMRRVVWGIHEETGIYETRDESLLLFIGAADDDASSLVSTERWFRLDERGIGRSLYERIE